MLDSEWQAALDPDQMFDLLRGRSTDRKYRCFARACLSAIQPFLYDELSQYALRELDRFVEGSSSPDKMYRAWQEALAAVRTIRDDPNEQRWYYLSVDAAEAVSLALHPDSADNIAGVAACCSRAVVTAGKSMDEQRIQADEQRRQVHLIRDIFGNPFCPTTFDAAWLEADIIKMASSICWSQAFDRLPRLADALLAAGCKNKDILNHLYSDGPHVVGCWALDLILGTS